MRKIIHIAGFFAVFFPSGHAVRLKFAASTRVTRATITIARADIMLDRLSVQTSAV